MVVKGWLATLLLIVSYCALGQDLAGVNLEWSPLEKTRYTVRSFLSDEKPPYTLNVRKGSGFFRKDYLFELNKDLSIGRKLRIQPTYEQIPLEYADAFSFHGKNYVFSYFNNRSHSATYLFATSVKATNFKPANDMRKVGQAPFINQRVSSNFSVQPSQNDSFILVYSELPPGKGNRELVRFSVLDKNLRVVKQEENKLTAEIETYKIEASQIDDHGNVYFVASLERSKNLLIRSAKEQVRMLYKTGLNGHAKVELKIPESRIVDYTLAIVDGRLKVMGFYSNSDIDSFDGVFSITYGEDFSSDPVLQKSPLPTDLVDQYRERGAGDKRGKNEDSEKGLINFKLVNMFIDTSGNAFLVSEYREFYSTAIFDGAGNEHFIDHFNHEKILVTAMNSAGQLKWVNQIPKYQYTTDDGGLYSSFVAILESEELFFFYNDSERNYKSDGSTIPYSEFDSFKRSDRSVFTMVEMNKETGKFVMKPLFSTKDVGVMIKPSVQLNLEPSSLLLYGDRGRKSRFLKISWKD